MPTYILIILSAVTGNSVATAEFKGLPTCQEAQAQIARATEAKTVGGGTSQYFKTICVKK